MEDSTTEDNTPKVEEITTGTSTSNTDVTTEPDSSLFRSITISGILLALGVGTCGELALLCALVVYYFRVSLFVKTTELNKENLCSLYNTITYNGIVGYGAKDGVFRSLPNWLSSPIHGLQSTYWYIMTITVQDCYMH